MRVLCRLPSEFAKDVVQNALSVLQNLHIPESKHANPALSEEEIPLPIPSLVRWLTVHIPIEFNRQLCRRVVEVEDVRTNRMLASEFEPSEASTAQNTPKGSLRPSRLATKLARTCHLCAYRPLTLTLSPTVRGRGDRVRSYWCHDWMKT